MFAPPQAFREAGDQPRRRAGGSEASAGSEAIGVRAAPRTTSAFFRVVGVATLAGALAGMAIGLGARVAMRISGAAAGPALVGARTENGNPVGDITLGGTVFLVFYAGLSSGVYGGLLCAALRPWLARAGAAGGVLFGLLLLAAFGTIAIRSANPDFRLFGPPLLNVLMFSALFVLFGVATVWLAERIDRLPRGRATSILLISAAVVGLLIFAITNVAMVPILRSILQGRSVPGVEFLRSLLLLDAFLVVAIAARWSRSEQSARAVTYAFLAVPVLVGLVLLVREVVAVLS